MFVYFSSPSDPYNGKDDEDCHNCLNDGFDTFKARCQSVQRLDTGETDVQIKEVTDDGANERGDHVDAHANLDGTAADGNHCARHDGKSAKKEKQPQVFPSPMETLPQILNFHLRDADVFP